MVGADGRSEGALRADLEETAGRLRGGWLARVRKRAWVMVAGGSQRERGGSDGGEGAGRHDVFMPMTITGKTSALQRSRQESGGLTDIDADHGVSFLSFPQIYGMSSTPAFRANSVRCAVRASPV